jgi:pyruvate,water dikinase
MQSKIILKGIPASPGRVKGKVKVLLSPQEASKMEKGDILVVRDTNPTYTLALLRASGVITEIGGRLSHAAIVAREFGIPCVVNTGNATKVLKDGMEIVVNGNEGIIYEVS